MFQFLLVRTTGVCSAIFVCFIFSVWSFSAHAIEFCATGENYSFVPVRGHSSQKILEQAEVESVVKCASGKVTFLYESGRADSFPPDSLVAKHFASPDFVIIPEYLFVGGAQVYHVKLKGVLFLVRNSQLCGSELELALLPVEFERGEGLVFGNISPLGYCTKISDVLLLSREANVTIAPVIDFDVDADLNVDVALSTKPIFGPLSVEILRIEKDSLRNARRISYLENFMPQHEGLTVVTARLIGGQNKLVLYQPFKLLLYTFDSSSVTGRSVLLEMTPRSMLLGGLLPAYPSYRPNTSFNGQSIFVTNRDASDGVRLKSLVYTLFDSVNGRVHMRVVDF